MIKLLEVEFPKKFNLSKEVKDLINKVISYFLLQSNFKQLLNKNPMYRIGTNGGKEEIMKHPWFNDINWKKVYDKKMKSPYIPDIKKEDGTDYFDTVFLD